VLGLAEGVHTITWHMNWDYNDTMLRGGHGLLRNNHQPKAGLPAYAMAIRTLEGAEFVGTTPSDGIAADPPAVTYEFRKDGRRIWINWAREKGVSWHPPAEEWELRDMMGVPLERNDRGGVELTEAPIYAFERAR
jgi:hypothetical protein